MCLTPNKIEKIGPSPLRLENVFVVLFIFYLFHITYRYFTGHSCPYFSVCSIALLIQVCFSLLLITLHFSKRCIIVDIPIPLVHITSQVLHIRVFLCLFISQLVYISTLLWHLEPFLELLEFTFDHFLPSHLLVFHFSKVTFLYLYILCGLVDGMLIFWLR